jgi:integrase
MSHGIYCRQFRHGRTWYLRYAAGGQEVKEKLGREADGFTRTMAKDALKARLGDIARGKFRLPEVRKPSPFRTLVVRYREVAEANHRGYSRTRYTLGQLEHEFGATPLAALSSFRFEQWKARRKKEVAPATVNRELTLLKAMLKKAVVWKLLDQNPAGDVKPLPVNNQRLRYLTSEELERLLEAARCDVAVWLAPAILLAVHTGLRQGELLRLRWQDIDEGLYLATIAQTKNNTPKHVPLNAAARAALAALPRDGATVLAWPWGGPVSNTTLHAAFKRTCTAAKIQDFRWHDLRHTFASHCVMAGVDLRTVQELLGHKTLEMTMRYSHLAPAHKAAAVEKLGAALTPSTIEPPMTIAATGTDVTPDANLERFRNVFSGRQTPAKREYLANQRVKRWRRGESNRPAREAGGRESSSPAELSRDYVPSSTASNL